ncbi:MAG: hypothetical protein SGILL_009369 [Bacillariaceae sp.]
MSKIHAASNTDGVPTSAYSSSYFAFSDKGKNILAKNLTSAFKGVLTHFEGIYNEEVKKVKDLCEENKWHIPGVYVHQFVIPSSGLVGYGRAKVKDLGTLDVLLDLADNDMAIHWARAKNKWLAFNSRLNTISSVASGIAQVNLEKLITKVNGIIDNQCQHAGTSSSVKDGLTELYELNLAVALSVCRGVEEW